eukprot:RCo043417
MQLAGPWYGLAATEALYSTMVGLEHYEGCAEGGGRPVSPEMKVVLSNVKALAQRYRHRCELFVKGDFSALKKEPDLLEVRGLFPIPAHRNAPPLQPDPEPPWQRGVVPPSRQEPDLLEVRGLYPMPAHHNLPPLQPDPKPWQRYGL